MFNLLPKEPVFFDLFEKLAQTAVRTSEHLRDLTIHFPNIAGWVQRIRDEEHAGDELAHAALERLDSCFITPFDREDIHELVGGLDDIVDEIDAVAKRFPLYHVKEMSPRFKEQAEVLVEATKVMAQAVGMLRQTRKLSELKPTLIELHRLENIGDDNNHAAVSNLFDGSVDAMDVLRWKELFDRVEKAIDKCEDVGNSLERIVLKNG